MGRTKRTGLSVGIGSSPQGSLSQGNVDSKVKELTKQEMINELTKAGVKFTKEDVIFVTKDKTGQLVWLEKGNSGAGLEHIRKHSNDFMVKHGVKSSNLVNHIKNVLEKGGVLSTEKKRLTNGKLGLEKIYLYKGKYYVLGAIGTNGYIVSLYPTSKKTAYLLMERNEK